MSEELKKEFDQARTKVMLAAQDWRRSSKQWYSGTTSNLAKTVKALEQAVDELEEVKVRLIKSSLAKERAESPDGMTSWDRVEKYRQEHGGELPPAKS